MKLSIQGQDYQVEVTPGVVIVGGEPLKTQLRRATDTTASVIVEGRPYQVEIKERNGSEVVVEVDGISYAVTLESASTPGAPPTTVAEEEEEREEAPVCDMPLLDGVLAPIPGRITAIKVREGQRVQAGDVLCILEAMKMENEIRAPKDGVVTNIRVREGASVNADEFLMQVC
jgi:biotin carboxyl carrier protein